VDSGDHFVLLKRGREFYFEFARMKMIKRKRVAGSDEISGFEKPVPLPSLQQARGQSLP
jgi:hypothetical protein